MGNYLADGLLAGYQSGFNAAKQAQRDKQEQAAREHLQQLADDHQLDRDARNYDQQQAMEAARQTFEGGQLDKTQNFTLDLTDKNQRFTGDQAGLDRALKEKLQRRAEAAQHLENTLRLSQDADQFNRKLGQDDSHFTADLGLKSSAQTYAQDLNSPYNQYLIGRGTKADADAEKIKTATENAAKMLGNGTLDPAAATANSPSWFGRIGHMFSSTPPTPAQPALTKPTGAIGDYLPATTPTPQTPTTPTNPPAHVAPPPPKTYDDVLNGFKPSDNLGTPDDSSNYGQRNRDSLAAAWRSITRPFTQPLPANADGTVDPRGNDIAALDYQLSAYNDKTSPRYQQLLAKRNYLAANLPQ